MNAIYTPTAAEIAAGFVVHTLTTTGNRSCPPESDQVTQIILPEPIVEAGGPFDICSNNPVVYLNGSVTNAGNGVWSGGLGTYAPHDSLLNGIYTATATEVATGSMQLTLTSTQNGPCLAVSDLLDITFTPSPTADAGPDMSVCANNPSIDLTGSVTNAAGGIWLGGTGSFSNIDTLNRSATYTPSADEITNGGVELIFETALNGNCLPVQDRMYLTIDPAPVVDAGGPLQICDNTPSVAISGTVSPGFTASWTGNGGTFSPDANSLNTTYNTTSAERASASFQLVLQTDSMNGCLPESDILTVNVQAGPSIDAGPDLFLCENNARIDVQASFTNAGGGLWSGGEGSFVNIDEGTASATYTPSQNEIDNNVAAIIVNSTNNGICPATSDTLLLIILATPEVDAGLDSLICISNTTYTLSGSHVDADFTEWSSTTGGNFSPSIFDLDASYQFTAADQSQGYADIILRGVRNTCLDVFDTVRISLENLPVVNAGIDQNICENDPDIDLNGSISPIGGVEWLGAGGIFSATTNLNTTYNFTAAEVLAGTTTIQLRSTDTSICAPVYDDVVVTFTPAPSITITAPASICENNPVFALSASTTVASGVSWSGAGSFSPVNTILNPSYIPTAAELLADSITVYATSTGNATCNPVTDSVKIAISDAPVVNAGIDTVVCENYPTITLNASVSNGATTGIWTNGLGNYSPSNTDLNATYTLSLGELNAGFADLILVSTNNGDCSPERDTVRITTTPAPIVNAGPDIRVCESVSANAITGSVTGGATGGLWTSLGHNHGSFANIDEANASADFTPASQDVNRDSVDLVLTSTGNGLCLAVTDTLRMYFDPTPFVFAGNDTLLCTNQFPLSLNAQGNAGTWSGGDGTFSPSNTFLNASYSPGSTDIANGSVTLTFTSTPTGSCPSANDSFVLSILDGPISSTVFDTTYCYTQDTIQVEANISNISDISWESLGAGHILDTMGTVINYVIDPADISNGYAEFVALTTNLNAQCPEPNFDTITVTFQPEPIINAGADLLRCKDVDSVQVIASLTHATTGTWSTSGTGSFTNATLNETYYHPSSADTANGNAVLYFASDNIGSCLSYNDSLVLDFTPVPTIQINPIAPICADAASFAVAGSVTVATQIQWTSSSDGSFSPTNIGLNSNYNLSGTDAVSDHVMIYANSINNGDCKPVIDSVRVTIEPLPVITVADTLNFCSNEDTIALASTYINADGLVWQSSGSGSFINTDTIAGTTSYLVSSADSLAGTVYFTSTTLNSGACNTTNETTVALLAPTPSLNVGSDITICKDRDTLNVVVTAQNQEGINWLSDGTGSYENTNTQSNAYYPSQNDKDNDQVNLIVHLDAIGTCPDITDTILVNFTPSPTLSLPDSLSLCASEFSTEVIATYTVSSGVTWSSDGTGSFSPLATRDTVDYLFSSADTSAGQVNLFAQTTGNGSCYPRYDTTHVHLQSIPQVSIADTLYSCANNPDVALNAAVSNATAVVWSSASGSFADPSSPTTTFTPSATQINNGFADLSVQTVNDPYCAIASQNVHVIIYDAPTLNAGPDLTICSTEPSININPTLNESTGITWSTTGTGIIPASTVDTLTYSLSAIDALNDTLWFYAVTQNRAECLPAYDTVMVDILPASTVQIDKDSTCGNLGGIPLEGIVDGVSSTGLWASSGSGTFSPDPSNMVATYYPNPTDITSGGLYISLTSTNTSACPSVSDSIYVSFITPQVADAGPDKIVCANNNVTTLNGVITDLIGTPFWYTDGSGYFADPNQTSTTYTPTAADIVRGGANLYLSTINSNGCPESVDSLYLNITPAPTVTVTDQTLCSDKDSVDIAAVVTVATGGSWTSLTGGTISDVNNLSTSYFPTSTEKSNGLAQVVVTSTGNGLCIPVRDTLNLNLTPAPVILAGGDQTLCKDVTSIVFTGSVSTATGGTWTNNGTGLMTELSADGLMIRYNFSAADFAEDSLIFSIVSTGNGDCNSVNDSLTVYLTPAPIVDATDITFCIDDGGTAISGSSTIGGSDIGGYWTSLGAGTFAPSDSIINTYYTPDASDMSNGAVDLVLTSLNNGTCAPVSDTISLTLANPPTALAPGDTTLCKDNTGISLAGNNLNAGGAIWSSNGTGTFSSNDSLSMTADYQFSAADLLLDSLAFVLTTTQNGICEPGTDTLNLVFVPEPTLDITVNMNCIEPGDTISLNSTIMGVTSWVWSSSGTGNFDNTALANPLYVPSSADLSNGDVTIYLQSLAQGICQPIRDSLTISFQTPPDAVLADFTVCADTAFLSLSPSIINAAGSNWTTTGTGSFNSINPATGYAEYQLSAAEIDSGYTVLVVEALPTNMCDSDFDSVRVDITPAPTASILNTQVCSNLGSIEMTGSGTIASAWQWSTSGDGTFDNPTSLTSNYNFGATDNTNGGAWIILSSTSQGQCKPIQDSLEVFTLPAPAITVTDDTTFFCANEDSLISVAVFSNSGGAVWSSFGSGTILAIDTASGTVTYQPSADDITNGSVYFMIVTANHAECKADTTYQTMALIEPATSTAPSDFEVCIDTNGFDLSGTYTNSTGAFWTSSGSGTFSNQDTTAATASYAVSNADTTLSSLDFYLHTVSDGICPSEVDTVNVTFNIIPIVQIADEVICSDAPSIDLSTASITNSADGIWSTNGDGAFTANEYHSSAPSYVHSNNDITRGTVTLTLTSFDNGACAGVSDSINIEIAKLPSATVQADFSICEDVDTIFVSGNFAHADSAYWQSLGGGAFLPDTFSTPGVYYLPDATDITNGSVQMQLQTVGSIYCPQAVDSLTISFTPRPTIATNADITTCIDSTQISLNATSTVATQIEWHTTGSGTFTPNINSPNPVYTASQADTSNHSVYVYAITTQIGTCKYPQVDSTLISFELAPTVNAGLDSALCMTEDSVMVMGSSQNTYGAVWSSGGSGSFTSTDTTNNSATYYFSLVDKSAGIVNLILSTVGNAYCPSESDVLQVRLNPELTTNLDSNITVCADADSIRLNYNLNNYDSIVWSSNMAGGFVLGDTSLSNTFVPATRAELLLTQPYLVLDIATLDGCSNRSDTVYLQVDSIPVIAISRDTSLCEDATNILLDAGITYAGGGLWSTNGAGSFAGGNADNAATYIFDPVDASADSVSFYIETTNNGYCRTYRDTLTLRWDRIPVINASANVETCIDRDSIRINNSLNNASGGYWTALTGGTFVDSTQLSPIYTFSANEVNNQIAQVQFTANQGIGACAEAYLVTNIDLFDAPTLSVNNDFDICSDTTAILLSANNSEPLNGYWTSTGTGSFSNYQSNTTSYTLSAADSTLSNIEFVYYSEAYRDCNAQNDTASIDVIPAPAISIFIPDVCADQYEVQLQATLNNANGVSWTTGGTGGFTPNSFIVNPLYQPSNNDKNVGNVVISAATVKENVCSPTSTYATLLISELPDVDAGVDQTLCPGDTAILIGASSNGIGFQWLDSLNNILDNDVAYDEIVNNDKTFTLEVTDLNGCTNRDTADVIIITPPSISAPPYLCLEDGVTISAIPAYNPSVGGYQWFRNDTLLFGENTLSHYANDVGLHKLLFQYRSCTSEANIDVLGDPVYDVPSKIVCENDSTTLEVTDPLMSVVWTLPNGTNDNANPVAMAIDTTQYILYELRDTSGCVGNDSVLLNTIPNPILTIANDVVCDGETLELNGQPANVAHAQETFTWFFNNQLMVSAKSQSTQVQQAGLYTLMYQVGECVASADANIQFSANPVPVNDDMLKNCFNQVSSVTLDAGPAHTYYWHETGDSSQTISVNQDGIYPFEIYNDLGCVTLDTIIVDDLCPPTIYTPNAFNPLCNCPDAFFKVFGKDFTAFKVTIFNRWGEIIYYSEDPEFEWDGSYLGEIMPIGAYPYIIEYSAEDEEYGGPYIIEGRVNLIK